MNPVAPPSRFASVLLLALLAATSPTGPAFATGRTEINQAVVDAGGGFPVSISAPGNYVLTGPLVVPASTDGFILSTNEVVFDLNGFSISGPATCNTTSCPSGTGMAIRGFSGIAHAHRSTVRNGTLRGFGDNCLRLGRQARVDDLLVTECGRNGISVAGGGVITNNRVLQVGENGILMSSNSAADSFAFNTVVGVALGGGAFQGVSGGHAVAGNSCDDGSCDPSLPNSDRRFYLSTNVAAGSAATTACVSGFHFASLFEILDVSGLRYDTALGLNRDDSGEGPPASEPGWIRTGTNDSQSTANGTGNCLSWNSDSGNGTRVFLKSGWDNPTGSAILPFSPLTAMCSSRSPVWCVED